MDSVGAMYIGLLISTVYVLTLLCYIALTDSHRDSLYGVACIQTWQYYIQYPRDSLGLKALVAAVWISDTVNLSLSCASIWNYVIANYANPAYLIVVDRPLVVQVLFNVRLCLPVSERRHVLGLTECMREQGFTALLVQLFFALRIWRLSHGKVLLTGTVVSRF
jgi:hypothetical protein